MPKTNSKIKIVDVVGTMHLSVVAVFSGEMGGGVPVVVLVELPVLTI